MWSNREKENNQIKKEKERKIKEALNKENTINPLSYLYNSLEDEVKIVESPSFSCSINSLEGNTIFLRRHSFTGFGGTLSLERTRSILEMENSLDFLKFLSIFSGRLYKIRSKHFISNVNQKPSLGFKKTLIGYHYNEIFHHSRAVGYNKKIEDLMVILKEKFTQIHFDFKLGYEWKSVFTENYNLGNILLGKKLIIKVFILKLSFNKYETYLSHIPQIKLMGSLVGIYCSFFRFQINIPKNTRLLLGKYILGI